MPCEKPKVDLTPLRNTVERGDRCESNSGRIGEDELWTCEMIHIRARFKPSD